MPSPAISKQPHHPTQPQPVPKSAAYGHVCVECAKAKVKCYPSPDGPCTRCHRRGQACTPSTPARRLGTKKASSSSSSRGHSSRLEGKLDHLVDLIRSQQSAGTAGGGPSLIADGGPQSPLHGRAGSKLPAVCYPLAAPHTRHVRHADQQHHHRQQQQQQQHRDASLLLSTPQPATTTTTPASSSAARAPAAESPASPGPDGRHHHLTFMTSAQAEHCLHTFRTGYMKYLPFVHFPPDFDVEQLRRDKPFLWLNIQGVCARPPSRQLAFGNLIREVLARQYVVEGERSMDLLLGTLTYLTWSQLYNRGRPQMIMMSHIARALMYDLKINKDLSDEALTGSVYAKVIELPKPVANHEIRRALLACYITSSVTTSFGRMAPLPWSLSMEDAAQQLHSSPETPNDDILVAIASARRIIDETSSLNKLHAEDPAGFGTFTAHIPALKAALDAERGKISPELRENRLLASYFDHAEVCVYELVLLQLSEANNTGNNSTATTAAARAATQPVPINPVTNNSTASSSLTSPNLATTSHPDSQNITDSTNTTTPPPASSSFASSSSSLLATARTNARRLSYLTSCLDAARRCVENLLSVEPGGFLYMTFSVVVQVLYSLQTLNRLALVDGVAGWDRAEARELADGLAYMRRMEWKLRDAAVILRRESSSSSAAAAAAMGGGVGDGVEGAGVQGTGTAAQHHQQQQGGGGGGGEQEEGEEEESSFSKGAELLKRTAEAWEMILNNNTNNNNMNNNNNANHHASSHTNAGPGAHSHSNTAASAAAAGGLKIDFHIVNDVGVGQRRSNRGSGDGDAVMANSNNSNGSSNETATMAADTGMTKGHGISSTTTYDTGSPQGRDHNHTDNNNNNNSNHNRSNPAGLTSSMMHPTTSGLAINNNHNIDNNNAITTAAAAHNTTTYPAAHPHPHQLPPQHINNNNNNNNNNPYMNPAAAAATFTEIGDAAMLHGVYDYSWMSDILAYWEL